jgi:hypothetical protein
VDKNSAYHWLHCDLRINRVAEFQWNIVDLLVDEEHRFYSVIPWLARCLLNPTRLQPVSIPEETNNETAKSEMELYLEEHIEFLHDLDASKGRRRKKMRTAKRLHHHSVHDRFCS